MDLSVLIPARNEMFLERTIQDVLAHARAETEVIAVLDGEWPEQPLPDHPRLRVTHSKAVIGQRAATNLAARMSTAKYVLKLDAHCSVDEGFDTKLIAAGDALGRDVTQIPAQYNHHAFNWKCRACGRETYQGPKPTVCVSIPAHDHELDVCPPACGAAAGFDRVMVWEPRHRKAAGNGSNGRGRLVRTEFWRFDQTLHFQYWDSYGDRPAAQGDVVDVMSSVGACFFMARDRFWELGGLDEAHGSWGQFGTEIACKSWLSGGRHVVNKRTWFSHLFRTQGKDFGFPYPQDERQVKRAREYSRKLWVDGTWPKAKYSLAWLLKKFAPVPDWPNQEVERETADAGPARAIVKSSTGGIAREPHDQRDARPSQCDRRGGETLAGTRGLIYYSDCRGDQRVLSAVREQIARANPGLPLVSATLQPIAFGRNLHLPLERGHLTMFKQILAALEALDTDIVFHVEHDVLYHPSHFDFVPPRRDTFYYNQNTWRVDAVTGQALFYYCSQVSGLCAYRDILVDHYRKRVAHVEQHGFERNLGFEPGTNRRAQALDGRAAATWMSAAPNVDIKTSFCLTPGRWSQDKFRNKNSCEGWQLADEIPGWGRTKGCFDDFLSRGVAA